MVSPRVRLKSAFAVPIAEARLSPCEGLNRQLEALFLARESDEHRNPTPAHVPQEEMFESRFNPFLCPEAGIQELRVFMLNCVGQTVMEASNLKADDLARLQIHNHTWFHVTRYAGSFVAHNHPLASWSAVYCVRPGERVPGQPGSGMLRLMDTRDEVTPVLRPGHAPHGGQQLLVCLQSALEICRPWRPPPDGRRPGYCCE
jgi:hypothetical protein